MRIPNWPLLIETIEFIIDHPDKYDQSQWRCGSTRCVAGWIAELSGGVWQGEAGPYIFPAGVDLEDEDNAMDAELVALQALGIMSYEQDNDVNEVANALFLGALSWREVLDNLADMADEDGIPLTPKILDELARITELEGSY